MDVQLSVASSEALGGPQSKSKAGHKSGAGDGTKIKKRRSRSPHPAVHDPGGQGLEEGIENTEEIAWNQLPTTDELAQSFLHAELQEETAELQAAIETQSQYLQNSTVSNQDGESELGIGTAAGLSLPGFVADFLRGVCDRLEVRITQIELSLAMEISAEVLNGIPSLTKREIVTLKLFIKGVNIESQSGGTDQRDRTREQEQALNDPDRPLVNPDVTGKRCITLRDIRGVLVANAALFNTLSRPPAPPSSSAAKTDDTPPIHPQHSSDPTESSSSSSDALGMTHSTILHASEESHSFTTRLDASVATSDGERFADAGVDDILDAREIGDGRAPSATRNSATRNSVLEDSLFRHQLQDSRFEDGNIEDSATLPAFALDSSILPTEPKDLLPDEHDHITMATHSNNLDTDATVIPGGGSPSTSNLRSLDAADRSRTMSPFQSPLLQDHRPLQTKPTDNLASGEQAFYELAKSDRGSDAAGIQSTHDLSESKLFSHEEAASMYMSAISHTLTTEVDGMAVPGGWNASSPVSDNAEARQPDSGSDDGITASIFSSKSGSPVAVEKLIVHSIDRRGYDERNETPKPQSQLKDLDQLQDDGPLHVRASSTRSHIGETRRLSTSSLSNSPETSYSPPLMIKCVLEIDHCSIRIPIEDHGAVHAVAEMGTETEPKITSSDYSDMPGAFSRMPEQKRASPRARKAASRDIDMLELLKSSGHDHKSTLQSHPTGEISPDPTVDFRVSTVQSQFDFSAGRLLAMVLQQLLVSLGSHGAPSEGKDVDVPKASVMHYMKVEGFSLRLLEHLPGTALFSLSEAGIASMEKADSLPSDILLASTVEGLQLSRLSSHDSSTVQISMGTFLFGYATENILSFDASLKMRDSIRDDLSPVGKDLSVSIVKSGETCKINVTTLPIHVRLDLQRLDETFSWFGGFSGILELGSSMASTTTVVSASTARKQSPKRSRTVHFEATAPQVIENRTTQQSSNKANARIGGFVLDLVGRLCSVRLESTAMKLVSREEGIGLQVDLVKLYGPCLLDEDRESSIIASLTNIRVEYLSTPKEIDLGRLLSLLTPSADKYDHDDDILLETLLRQRRQGGVLRVTMANVEAEVLDLNSLNYMPTLMDDISKLSTVAKYLPEDDRPGVLILGLIRDLKLHVRANQAVGDLQSTLHNLEVAHVGLPSLFALCIERLRLQRNEIEELVGEAVDINSPTHGQTPMVMARMIGDELEPTIKIKVWNLRLEYRVPTIMAALGLSDTMTAEDFAAEMVNSVVTLTAQAVQGSPKPPSESPSSSAQSSSSSRPVKLDLVFRDSLVGLNPLNLPHRGLFVIADSRFIGSVLKRDNACATLEIKKATLLIIDDIKNITPTEEQPESSPVDRVSKVQELCNMGYVPVSYISSAKAQVNITTSSATGENSVDVEFRDDLFVLESCADSTQTIFGILNGLKPPMPPSKDVKYRTEIVPVQDMLSSLSGDAFAQVEGHLHTGYDDPLQMEDADMVDDDIPQNFEFVNNYYRNESQSPEGLADSMLQDDLRYMANAPGTREMGAKNLLQSFEEQYEIAPGGRPLEFREDHFGTRPAFQGKAHRWDSAQNTYSLENDSRIRGSPLRVRVRDVHFIWNLFDGYDWQKTRDIISKTVKEVETRATERRVRNDRRLSADTDEEEESVIGDFLFNSIYIGIPANRDPRELSHQINRNVEDHTSETESYATSTISGSPSRQGQAARVRRKKLRLTRSKHHKMTFELKGVSADFIVFAPNSGEAQSSLDVRVKDLEIFDHVPTSTWKKFATYMHDAGERESDSNMIHLELMNIKPVLELAASEIVLKVKTRRLVVGKANLNFKATVLPLRLHVDQDALDFMTRFFEFKDDTVPMHASKSDVPFLQRVEINSVRVKLDFKPKRVDYAGLRSGHTTEFMNFFILDQADMVLRHVIIYGVSGFEKLGKTLNDIWMPDVKQNQLPGVLAGLAPVRSLANVGGGVRDLVVVPMREYRKDGRIVRSIQKGALVFAKTTTSELVKLGAKLAIGTQTVLQSAEDFLKTPGSRADIGREDAELDEDEKKQISLYADQPVGVMQGLRGAYASLERDLLTARDAIVAVPGEVIESGSAGGAAKAVLRSAPTIIFRPAIGASKAISQTLMGATNSLDPQNRRRVEDVSRLPLYEFAHSMLTRAAEI